MELTDFLLSLPVDKLIYCHWIENESYSRLTQIQDMMHSGYMKPSEIDEEQAEWRLNLPSYIKKQYPTFTAQQIEYTCIILADCVYSDYYLDCLFASLNRAIAKERGRILATDRLNLQLTGSQLN